MSEHRLEVADVFRTHGDDFLARWERVLSRPQRKAFDDIRVCRTAALGGHLDQCDQCGHCAISYNSCRNRSCPKCQAAVRAQWLAERQAELLPVEYFHVVFTLPQQIARLALHNARRIYSILFRAVAETLLTIAADPQHLGAAIGFLAVLHTWGQTLHLHPHIHCVVPGGGISPDNSRWIPCRKSFFLPVKVLSRFFRKRFLIHLRKAFQKGKLQFHGELESLAQPAAFDALRRKSRQGPQPLLSQEVSDSLAKSLSEGQAPIPRRTGIVGPTGGLRRTMSKGRSDGMGGLHQASLRRARTGSQISGPIHAPRCHLQPETAIAGSRSSHLRMEGLCRR